MKEGFGAFNAGPVSHEHGIAILINLEHRQTDKAGRSRGLGMMIH